MEKTLDELVNAPAVVPKAEDQPTLDLWPTTGQILGISRASTYAAASRGEIPTIRFGARLLVPTAALRRMLKLDAEPIAS